MAEPDGHSPTHNLGVFMDLSFITADLLNNISWFDGIMYIILGLIVYAIIRWINKKI